MCIALQGGLWAQESTFQRGEELFMAKKPGEALGFLEGVLIQDPGHVKASLYLGIVYQNLNRLDDAVAVYRKVLPRAGNEAARVAYNLGTVYLRKGDDEYAEEFFSQAIALDSAYGPAYLNRANLRIKKGELAEALPDYDLYLSLEPRSPQRARIEQLCALIRGEFAAAERRQIFEAEEAERQRIRAAEEAERQRILAEQEVERRRILAEEAEARRQALLREVSASLQSAAEETRGSSAGTEEILGYDGEFELE
ncbi:MAG: tetratricopeptide repeat protein [Treponema sp.]|jgi:tetratricopeptide (TPR) repeat protein|nr:tetratricopeptide repeat protein [Treponema sp.]